MRLGMVTGGAGRERFIALEKIAAIAAAPHLVCLSFKKPSGIDIGRQVRVSFFVLFFGDGNGTKNLRDITEALFFGCFGKTGIHFRVSEICLNSPWVLASKLLGLTVDVLRIRIFRRRIILYSTYFPATSLS